jgi:hypothetical protein
LRRPMAAWLRSRPRPAECLDISIGVWKCCFRQPEQRKTTHAFHDYR